MNYDIIGDIHGYHETLISLLEKLGYRMLEGAYKHPDRQAIFLGDFIDRGKGQREVITIVRSMVEAGSAKAIMGNHEYNAIGYCSKHPVTGEYLRPHTDKNRKQHKAFLEAYEFESAVYQEAIDWFKTLPLWLDLGDMRCIHACWDQGLVDKIMDEQDGSALISEELLIASFTKNTWQYEAIETILKGKEIPLTNGSYFHDKDGNKRHNIRVRWWDSSATSYRVAYMGPEEARTHIPDDQIEGDHLVEYGHYLPPVFLGHYWLEGDPKPLAKNIACLDYSVAKPGGKLVAYRWSGEKVIDVNNFITMK